MKNIAITKVWFDKTRMFVELNNNAVIGSPIALYPNLRKGSPYQRKKVEIWCKGTSLRWENLDEDISLEGLLSYINRMPSFKKTIHA